MNNKLILVTILLALMLTVAACQKQEFLIDEENNLDINITTNDTTEEPVKETEIDMSKVSFTVEAVEGELAKIPVQAYDPDGDKLTYSFDKLFNNEGLWLTKIGDEGKYLVKVTVSDGLISTSDFVLVNILRANRPPTMECPATITVEETQMVIIDCNIFDEDGDPVIVSYDGWMKSSTRTTNYGDAGEYSVIVRSRDQKHEVSSIIKIVVQKKNRAPLIEEIPTMRIVETEMFKLNAKVSDPDGDIVILTYSKPLNAQGTWTPDFGDRGTYEITVVASDGKLTATETFDLIVERKNRAPVLKEILVIKVFEGETVKIPVQAYDPDGDDITVSYSGWMNSAEYTTTYDDAHPKGCSTRGCTATYFVTVMVSDGVLETSQVVEVQVTDKNRAPQIIWE